MNKNRDKNLKFATRAIHAGQPPDPHTGAIMTPIYQSSTFVQKSPGSPISDYEYSRTQNPTRAALEDNLASLEQGNYGLCFASGCAALTAVIHLLSPGEQVIMSDDVYSGTFRLFDKIFKDFGIQCTLVDLTDANKLQSSLTKKTKLIWIETPTNPMLKIIDIQQTANILKAYPECLLAIDNTFATPYLQTPLSLGADIVCHSTSKYIGGHSDLIGGALIMNSPALYGSLQFIQNALGAIPGPQDCFLQLRAIKTLTVRMRQHCENAKQLADFLNDHPKVEKVIYPGLATHPGFETAKKQMRDFGGMMSLIIKGGLTPATHFLEKLQLFTLAESLGGVESLIEHPGLMTHGSYTPEHRKKLGIEDGLVRLSVGIEAIEDLTKDIERALG